MFVVFVFSFKKRDKQPEALPTINWLGGRWNDLRRSRTRKLKAAPGLGSAPDLLILPTHRGMIMSPSPLHAEGRHAPETKSWTSCTWDPVPKFLPSYSTNPMTALILFPAHIRCQFCPLYRDSSSWNHSTSQSVRRSKIPDGSAYRDTSDLCKIPALRSLISVPRNPTELYIVWLVE